MTLDDLIRKIYEDTKGDTTDFYQRLEIACIEERDLNDYIWTAGAGMFLKKMRNQDRKAADVNPNYPPPQPEPTEDLDRYGFSGERGEKVSPQKFKGWLQRSTMVEGSRLLYSYRLWGGQQLNSATRLDLNTSADKIDHHTTVTIKTNNANAQWQRAIAKLLPDDIMTVGDYYRKGGHLPDGPHTDTRPTPIPPL
jgi:hypothetical protein